MTSPKSRRTAGRAGIRVGAESAVVGAIRQGLAAHSIPCFRLNSGAVRMEYQGHNRFVRFSFKGAPDLVALLPTGHTLWIEAKSATGKLSEAQIWFRDLCALHGTPWVLARSWDDVAPYTKGKWRNDNAHG